MVLRTATALVVLLAFGARCGGAELFYLDHDPFTEKYVGPVGPLVLSGDIEAGDYDLLLAKILDDEQRFLSQNKIVLASDGGDVTEAMKIGKFIKALFSEVIVGPQTGRCASACFLIYASAQQRATGAEHLIGINRPYLADSASTPPPQSAPQGYTAAAAGDLAGVESNSLLQVRLFLQENAVPPYLIDEMFRHASDDAYWLSTDDEKKLGYRSKSLDRYLAAKCAWNDSTERDVYAGRRPFDDLTRLWKCRDEATRPDAHQALMAAAKEKLSRDRAH